MFVCMYMSRWCIILIIWSTLEDNGSDNRYCRSYHCTLIILQHRRVVLLYLLKRAGCVHSMVPGALQSSSSVMTVCVQSPLDERIWWIGTLTTWADVIASVKVGVALVVIGLREWEYAISQKITFIEMWQVLFVWIQCFKEVNHLHVICLRSTVF